MDKFPSAEEHQAEHSPLQKTTEQTTAVVQQQLSMGRKMTIEYWLENRTPHPHVMIYSWPSVAAVKYYRARGINLVDSCASSSRSFNHYYSNNQQMSSVSENHQLRLLWWSFSSPHKRTLVHKKEIAKRDALLWRKCTFVGPLSNRETNSNISRITGQSHNRLDVGKSLSLQFIYERLVRVETQCFLMRRR